MKGSLAKAVEKGKMAQDDANSLLARIKGTTDMVEFKDCDLVVEAAIENLDLKKKIFIDLDRICNPGAILSTNTSCLSVMDVAAVTKRPDKVLGCHFFNPVPLMKLLELVKTITTSKETLDAAVEWGKSLGKTVIVAPDRPGFIVNRSFLPYMVEAFEMYENGVATREDIDTGVQLGLNHPMGRSRWPTWLDWIRCSSLWTQSTLRPKIPSSLRPYYCARWSRPATWDARPARDFTTISRM